MLPDSSQTSLVKTRSMSFKPADTAARVDGSLDFFFAAQSITPATYMPPHVRTALRRKHAPTIPGPALERVPAARLAALAPLPQSASAPPRARAGSFVPFPSAVLPGRRR